MLEVGDQFQVALLPGAITRRKRPVTVRFAVTDILELQKPIDTLLLRDNVLLEKGRKHDGRSTGILQPPRRVQGAGKR